MVERHISGADSTYCDAILTLLEERRPHLEVLGGACDWG
jgi:hypothetical protein